MSRRRTPARRKPSLVRPVSVRPTAEEFIAWQAWAQRRMLSLSDLIRRTMAEALELEAAVDRADREAVARAVRLARLNPSEIRELQRRRPGDWPSWPEVAGDDDREEEQLG
jgi:hypothetical protein